MTAKELITTLAKLATQGKHEFSRAELIVLSDGSGHLELDSDRVAGSDFKNADDLIFILEQIEKENDE